MTGRQFEWDWNIAVFCQNEQSRIGTCLDSIADASDGRHAMVTVIVNGSTDDSAALARDTARRRGLIAEVYTIPDGDKANAINHFFHTLRADARLFFFVDGYARISPAAFRAMDRCLSERRDVVAATGIAANGRTMRLATAATLAAGGQLHGQLHGLRRDFLDRLTTRNIRIPIGTYRGDGLVGSMAMHDLDPLNIEWDTTRIAGIAEAKYEIPALSMLRVEDVKRQLRRKIRQMRGVLETAAIRAIVYRHGYEGLPEHADDMIRSFLETHGVPAVPLVNRPFMALALRHHRQFVPPGRDRLVPELISR